MNSTNTQSAKRRMGAAVLALAMIAGVGAYHFLQPISARAAATSNAAPLDDKQDCTIALPRPGDGDRRRARHSGHRQRCRHRQGRPEEG